MARDEAYYQAEKKIEEALKSGATELDLSIQWDDKKSPKLTEIPISLRQLTKLQGLNLSNHNLITLPNWLEELKQLQWLEFAENQLTELPDWIGSFSQLTSLDITSNKITLLPNNISDLKQLAEIFCGYNKLTVLPDFIKHLPKIRKLHFHNNNIKILPEWIGTLTNLRNFTLNDNPITSLHPSLEKLIQLEQLCIGPLTTKEPNTLPEWIRSLKKLRQLEFTGCNLTNLPDWLFELKELSILGLSNNLLTELPVTFAQFEHLEILELDGNPLNPELAEANKQGVDAVKLYLRAGAVIPSYEAKLILVGEGEVGKTCLMDALLNKPWQEHPSTHGIEIQRVEVNYEEDDDDNVEENGEDIESQKLEITLNAWDFGGQRVYRPTHQLFFSAPAVYLVVWKPREGSQAGQVKEWIQLVKRREPSAKILIVATHGGPQQRQPDIDRQELWDLFGKDIVVDFFFVESKPDEHGNRKGIDELKRAIAQVAASLPEVGRSVPKSFADVRQALQDIGAPYLPLREVLDICRAQDMDDEIARLFITISHRLGHLTHYENDPTLRDIVILRPDWLATAMSYVLDDEATRAAHGLVKFSRLSQLWDDKKRTADSRYPATLHPIFLRLMERFDLSYRVADLTSRGTGDPLGRPYDNTTSLIGQLVPDIRPQNLSAAWESSPASGDIQQTQICHIVDASNGQSASAEGLFYQLIVRLHKYSLGRADYNASVHWQRGLVLEDEYKSRAFLEHVGNDVRITVRSPYPEGLLGMLTREVKFLVESFWEGLHCDVMVPCIEPCGKHAAGTGLFEVEKLMNSKRKNRHEFPCPVCDEWQNIDSLLRNAPAATQAISLADLQSEFASLKSDLRDDMNINTRRILSQVDKTYTDLLQVLTDEAKEGPRLFSFFPVDRSAFNPKTWVREKFRLVLWCEHSRLPLPVLNNGDMKKGVYDLELEREWFKKASPYLKFLTGTLGMVLPVASSAVKLALDETAYKLIEEQLDFGKSIIDTTLGETAKIGDFLGAADSTHLEHGVALRSDGSTLRELHALLKAKDPGFGGLVRVMNKRQEFLWVHEKFAGEY
jgi:Leucine-rich repeat (LRR) protein